MSALLDLFPAETGDVDRFSTEGIKYAGSKLKLLREIDTLLKLCKGTTVLDGFSGSTRVSQFLARSGYMVVSNDIAEWSRVFGVAYLKSRKDDRYYSDLINHLNNVKPIDGWFSANYGASAGSNRLSIGKDGGKKPWQIHNTRKLDGVRQEIDRLRLDEGDKCVALASLMLALDKVDSTIGHFVSYLAEWSPRSYKTFSMLPPASVRTDKEHTVLKSPIADVVGDIECDIAYFDPPYGSNNEKMPPSRVRYNSYYHVWTTICLNDQPNLFGKASRRSDSSDKINPSPFESYRRLETGQFEAVYAIDRLLGATKANSIILSYSSGGRATAEELHQVLRKHGKLKQVIEVDYKTNVMGAMRWTNEWIADAEKSNVEFLFLIDR